MTARSAPPDWPAAVLLTLPAPRLVVFAIAACYAFELFLVHPDWGAVAHGVLVPKINSESIYIAVSMLGATVMPHVIYLHSALVQHRVKEDALSDHPEKWLPFGHGLESRFR